MSLVIPVTAAVVVLVLIMVWGSFLEIGSPDELVVISGAGEQLKTGAQANFKIIHGGRRFRWPVFETVDRIDLTVRSVHIHIDGAYSEGGIPINVHAIANVKVSSDPKRYPNAIERFLGQGSDEVEKVAKDTLEGNVRAVVSNMTPEEVNEDRLKFKKLVSEDVGSDFEKMGLELDTLKIQEISDEKNYLDSLGREATAKIIKKAEVAESNARKEAEEAEAEAKGRGEVARQKAQAEIQKAQNSLRELEADLDRKAKSEEERAQARAQEARAEAEQELQQVRTELEKIRLQADVVIPAEAEKVAQELKAQGEAAEIAEQGRAMARVIALMAEVWHEAGDAAMDVFVLQRLESIMDRVAEAARQVEIRNAAIIDSGDGDALPNYVSSFPKIVGGIFDEMRDTVGLDIGGALTGEDGVDGEARQEVLAELRSAVQRQLEEGDDEVLDELGLSLDEATKDEESADRPSEGA